MKNRTKIRLAFALISLLCLVLTLSACGNGKTILSDSGELLPAAQAMANAVRDDNAESVMALVDTRYISSGDVSAFMETLRDYLGEHSTSEVKGLTAFKASINNGVSSRTEEYLVDTDNLDYYLTVIVVSGSEKIAGFNIITLQDLTYTGTLFTMKGANALQWLFLIYSLCTFAFSVYMTVDCLKRKCKHKVWCMILILLGCIGFTFSLSAGSFDMNMSLAVTFAFSALKIYGSGAISAYVMLPVGSIVYFFIRKRITMKPTVEAPIYPAEFTEAVNEAPTEAHEASDKTN